MALPDIDWQRVEELFHRAHDLPLEDVDTWLEGQTRGDAPTRREVRSLLIAERKHVELSAVAQTSDVAGPPSPAAPPERFGAYQTERVLARGGMGVVYLARRADGQFEQTVAIKVMAGHLAGDGDFLRKFRTECQLLAQLTHPHITRLLDGGFSASGDPYLVMEYVEGQSLDRYCDQGKLAISERLGLFLQVCDAVDFAHRNMVLHRDLKPGNVLVMADGVVKLLDFGTASLMGENNGVTVAGARMLTPRYAGPEQLRGERSSIAADIFSLGVILYELLTGSWPFGNADSMVGELERATGRASPIFPPSAVTEDAASFRSMSRKRLQRFLEGDLSSITLKALEHDPSRRYGAVRDLAGDIGRFLDGRPVRARAQTAVYRAGKFLRRRWLPVSAAAVFLSGMGAASIVAVHQAHVARAEALKSEQVNRFLTDMLASASRFNFDPKKYTVAEMLDAADRRLEKGAKGDPLIEAIVRLNLASSYFALLRDDKVTFHLERAIPIFRAAGADRELAQALRLQAERAARMGQFEPAEHSYEEALASLARLGKTAPAVEVFLTKSALAGLLSLLTHQRPDKARALYRDLLLLGAADRDIPRTEVSRAMANWAGMLLDEGKDAEADVMLQDALATGRKEDPGGYWEFTPLYELTVLYGRQHNYGAAKEVARQLVEVNVRNVGSDHETTAQAKLIWARFAAETGETAAAAAKVGEAMPIIEKTHPSPSLELWHGARDAAHVLRLARSYAQAESYARQSLAVAQAAQMAHTDPRLANSWEELGRTLVAEKKYTEGIGALEQAEAIYRQAPRNWAKSADATHDLIGKIRRRIAAGRTLPPGALWF